MTWLGVIAALIAFAPPLVCTVQAPCGTEPLFAVLLACLTVGLIGLHRAPAAALVTLPLAGWLQITQDPDIGHYDPWLPPALGVVCIASAGYAIAVLAGSRRQRSLARELARSGVRS